MAWTFSTAAGAITVGPTKGSGDWYTSPPNGLVPEQYDDKFVFFVDGGHFQYYNNGLTIYPEQGYEALPFDAPTDATWQLTAGGVREIVLPVGSFIGVKDSGPVYEIVSLTPESMVLSSPLLGGDGFFTLYLESTL